MNEYYIIKALPRKNICFNFLNIAVSYIIKVYNSGHFSISPTNFILNSRSPAMLPSMTGDAQETQLMSDLLDKLRDAGRIRVGYASLRNRSVCVSPLLTLEVDSKILSGYSSFRCDAWELPSLKGA